jgi:hypothetical protein
MAAIFALPFLIAQATQNPALSPDWKTAPQRPGEYIRYVRQESDGSESTISATQRTCDCVPATLVTQLQTALSAAAPQAMLKREVARACGSEAEHLTATGVADGGPRSNLDVYAFRKGSSLYVLTYTFKAPLASPDAEAALLALCPPQTTSAMSRSIGGG